MPTSDEQVTQTKSRDEETRCGALAQRGVAGLWMDGLVYLCARPGAALRDLLPDSGIPNDAANIGFYWGLLFALFWLAGGCRFIWVHRDRFGRVRTLMLTSLLSLFTFLVQSPRVSGNWPPFRLLAVSASGRVVHGGTFVAENGRRRRKMGAG